jgi:predicted RNA-binding protein YlqC (UPF0109 family)
MAEIDHMKPTGTKSPQFEADIERLIRILADAFTEHHDDLRIECRPLPRRTVIAVTPHIDEYGKMIGTAGVRVNAIKTLVNAFALRHQRQVTFSLEKPPGTENTDRPKFKANPDWKSDGAVQLLQDVLLLLFTSATCRPEDRGDTTIINATVNKGEALADLAYEICDALDTIFQAIGKAQGRNTLGVDLHAVE